MSRCRAPIPLPFPGVPSFKASAFFFSSSLVVSETARWASIASCEMGESQGDDHLALPKGDWLFTMVVWIFSAIRLSLFWIMRIWGAIWMEMFRVSSRS